MFGGTPSNLAISIMERANIEVIAGVNLPMLVKLASVRTILNSARRWPSPGGGPEVHQRCFPIAGQGGRLAQFGRAPAAMPRSILTICNSRGLHARAAAKFVKLVSGFDAEVTVSKDGTTVLGTSIMGLMMLAAAPGMRIEVTASGPEETSHGRHHRIGRGRV